MIKRTENKTKEAPFSYSGHYLKIKSVFEIAIFSILGNSLPSYLQRFLKGSVRWTLNSYRLTVPVSVSFYCFYFIPFKKNIQICELNSH